MTVILHSTVIVLFHERYSETRPQAVHMMSEVQILIKGFCSACIGMFFHGLNMLNAFNSYNEIFFNKHVLNIINNLYRNYHKNYGCHTIFVS